MNSAIINERQPKDDTDWRFRTFVSRNKEVYVKFTNELMSFLNLEEYDQIDLIDNDDGTLTIRKENET
jgi:hypothetical protein